LPHGS